MKQIPVNKWTVGALALILTLFGGELAAPILKAIAVLSAPNLPAL